MNDRGAVDISKTSINERQSGSLKGETAEEVFYLSYKIFPGMQRIFV